MPYLPAIGDLVRDGAGMFGIVSALDSVAWANGTEEILDPAKIDKLEVVPLFGDRRAPTGPGEFTPSNFRETLEGRLPSQLERKNEAATASEQVLATQTKASP